MKSEKEKQLEIQLLTEKIQRISGKKVVFTESEDKDIIEELMEPGEPQEEEKIFTVYSQSNSGNADVSEISYVKGINRKIALLNFLTLIDKKESEDALELIEECKHESFDDYDKWTCENVTFIVVPGKLNIQEVKTISI